MKGIREKLEKYALGSVQTSGFKALSFRKMATEIGIKSSSVHYHFPEKSHLAKALIERYSAEFFQALDAIAEKPGGLEEKIIDFFTIFEEVIKENKLCLCGMMAAEVELLNDENRQLLADYFTKTEQWLVDLITQHQSEIKSSLSAQVLAKSLLSSLEGALLLDRVVNDNQRLTAQKELFVSMLFA